MQVTNHNPNTLDMSATGFHLDLESNRFSKGNDDLQESALELAPLGIRQAFCSICISDIDVGDSSVDAILAHNDESGSFETQHWFHKSCISPWVAKFVQHTDNIRCPNCNLSIDLQIVQVIKTELPPHFSSSVLVEPFSREDLIAYFKEVLIWLGIGLTFGCLLGVLTVSLNEEHNDSSKDYVTGGMYGLFLGFLGVLVVLSFRAMIQPCRSLPET